eukprot:GFUD01023021.1.p1 GENE.GFUD01023021.1~~GFUD01023021.1.p1  ORF type:complete len:193 (-),score=55.62 GFUD01023021.1:519-1097(-)
MCHQHSTQGPCKQGDLVLEADNTEYCGEEASCVHHRSCQHFLSDLARLAGEQPLQYQAGVARLSAQVCSRQLQYVCCQTRQTLTDTLQLPEILYLLARHHRLHLSCSPSPCTPSAPLSLPWPGRQGCFPLSGPGPSQDCVLDLVKEEQQEVVRCVKEDMDIAIRNVPMAYSHKCSQGRIWSRFRARCVKNFF